MMATVRHVTSSSGLRKFLMDFCSTECTHAGKKKSAQAFQKHFCKTRI